MFGKNASEDKAQEVKRPRGVVSSKTVDTVIGKNTELSGTIKTTGTIRIDGKFDGDINTTSDVVIGEEGIVEAEIHAVNLVIAGKLEGNVEVKGRLEMVPTGSLKGNAKVGVIVIDEGARLEGQVEMVVNESQKVVKQIEPKKEVASK